MARFDWDDAKAASNFAKHRVRFEDAITAFDEEHSDAEIREILLGRSGVGVVVVVFAIRVGDVIRIISARKASRAERVRYEQSKDVPL